jgi:cytochrome b561
VFRTILKSEQVAVRAVSWVSEVLNLRELHYGGPAKVMHWMIVVLLAAQYPIGWLMPDIHRGMQPGRLMNAHISVGITILAIIVFRLIWRLIHPVAPESSLPAWQRLSSELVHWLLYLAVLATTISGWVFASLRGWSLTYFNLVPLPHLLIASETNLRKIDGWHQIAEWTLLVLVAVHIAAAMTHIFIYRDSVMARMLPKKA